jgi:NADP-dependent 3-hydroxy acid dehydrogenase YdfG
MGIISKTSKAKWSLKQLVDAAVETYGRIDVMINNAGLMRSRPSSTSGSRSGTE